MTGSDTPEEGRLRALVAKALGDLSWCIGFIEQAGQTVPADVYRTRDWLAAEAGAPAPSDEPEVRA